MINIFVGFVIVTFQSEGEADFKNCPLDKNQRNCIEFALNAKPIKLYIPKNPFQYKLWAFATSPLCENTVFFAIVLNTISLAMKFYHQPEWYTDFLDVLNLFFTFFFVGEFMLKFGAFRFKNYFSDPWNGFDFFIVVGSLVDLGAAQVNEHRRNNTLKGTPLSLFIIWQLTFFHNRLRHRPMIKAFERSHKRNFFNETIYFLFFRFSIHFVFSMTKFPK
jgi:hypothetical protein